VKDWGKSVCELIIEKKNNYKKLYTVLSYLGVCTFCTKTKLYSVALVRTRTIPTERPPPVGEVSAFADRGVSRGQRNGSPQPLISVF